MLRHSLKELMKLLVALDASQCIPRAQINIINVPKVVQHLGIEGVLSARPSTPTALRVAGQRGRKTQIVAGLLFAIDHRARPGALRTGRELVLEVHARVTSRARCTESEATEG